MNYESIYLYNWTILRNIAFEKKNKEPGDYFNSINAYYHYLFNVKFFNVK